jgi:hypothetical protein
MTTLEYLHRHVLPAAYAVLPAHMQSPKADAMLLAIALQESKAAHRRQIKGPARGFWQFEMGGGTRGVLTHPSSKLHIRSALTDLCYRPTSTAQILHPVLEHNDVLACVFARLLLWTLPQTLPEPEDVTEGWAQYLEAWRPGRPHPKKWSENHTLAWAMVLTP